MTTNRTRRSFLNGTGTVRGRSHRLQPRILTPEQEKDVRLQVKRNRELAENGIHLPINDDTTAFMRTNLPLKERIERTIRGYRTALKDQDKTLTASVKEKVITKINALEAELEKLQNAESTSKSHRPSPTMRF